MFDAKNYKRHLFANNTKVRKKANVYEVRWRFLWFIYGSYTLAFFTLMFNARLSVFCADKNSDADVRNSIISESMIVVLSVCSFTILAVNPSHNMAVFFF